MLRAELLGRHTHETANGVSVHIWTRDGRYLARGYVLHQRFGKTLGKDEHAAEAALRRIMTEIENGSFVRSSERPRRHMKGGPPPRLTVRELVDRYLADARQRRGRKTARDYRNRLMPLIEFAEQPDNLRRWPTAQKIDQREFALRFRAWLFKRSITRNGHPLTEPKPLSQGQVYNILSTTVTLLHWARRPEVNLLPMTFINPFTPDIVGRRPTKDPLRKQSLPVDLRIRMVRMMDAWQLCTIGPLLVLPQRPEELAGLLIGDVDHHQALLCFGDRLGGDDATKGRTTFQVPVPPALTSLFAYSIDGRHAGPVFRRRTIWDGRRRPQQVVANEPELEAAFHRVLAERSTEEIQTPQDRKAEFRRLLRRMGATHVDDIRKEFKSVLEDAEPGHTARLYDTRGSVTTDLKRAGVDPLVRRYVTGHAIGGDIMSHYESIDLQVELEPYFRYVEPLLNAMSERAAVLGLAAPQQEVVVRQGHEPKIAMKVPTVGTVRM